MTDVSAPHTTAEPHVRLNNITKAYGDKQVLTGVDLSVEPGELVALLGPSGCGKTTSLRILAGLETADSGTVTVGKRDITKLAVRKRNMGIVFQSYSLFPHMNAIDNVAYGLKMRGVAKAQRTKKAEEMLGTVGLAEHVTKFPTQLSGGQQQRVALARALVIEPDVLLLDEPLSALDAKVRTSLREEIRRIQLASGIATLMVTHDQEEALTMADRVGVMREGRIEQIGTPHELYMQPATPFISSFVGVTNRLMGFVKNGTIDVFGSRLECVNDVSHREGKRGVALIRPEDIVVQPATSTRPHGTVLNRVLRGSVTSLLVNLPERTSPVRIDMASPLASAFQTGDKVELSVSRTSTVVDDPSPEDKSEPTGLNSRSAADYV